MDKVFGYNLSVESMFGVILLLVAALVCASVFDSRKKLRVAQQEFEKIEQRGVSPKSLAFRQAGGLINQTIILAVFKTLVAFTSGLAGWSLLFPS